MANPGWWRTNQRLLVIVVLGFLLTTFGQLSLAETSRRPWLGLRVVPREGHFVVSWVQPAGLAWDAGIRPGYVVDWIEGSPVSLALDPSTIANTATVEARPPGGAAIIASAASAAPVSAQRRLSFLLLATCFALIGSVVFVLSTELISASVFLFFAVATATALLGAIASPFGRTWVLAAEYVALISFGASTLLLFTVFPINRGRTRVGRWMTIACVLVHLVLLAGYGFAVFFDTLTYMVLQKGLWLSLIADLIGASVLASLALVGARSKQQGTQRLFGLIAFGTVASFAPFSFLALLPGLLGVPPIVDPDIAILSAVFLPISMGVAILSRQFLGITRLLRRSVVALAVWIALIAFYSQGFALLRQRLLIAGRPDLVAVLTLPLLDIAVVAGTFPFLQHQLRRALERILFHDVYDYATTLQELGSEIVRLTRVEEIANHVLARLGQTLDLSWAAIVLRPGTPGAAFYRWGDSPIDLDHLRIAEDSPSFDGDTSGRSAESAPRIVPLLADGVGSGSLIIGPKKHDLELLAEDTTLVNTLAPLLGTALHNALLVDRLEQQVVTLGERERVLAALSTRLMQVQEEERRRLALELHDDPLQRAILLARQLEADSTLAEIREWRQEVEEIVIALRAICSGLRPAALDDFGLIGALEWLIASFSARSDLSISLAVETADDLPLERLDGNLEVALFRVTQEALNNCLKHANASQVQVRLWQNHQTIHLSVADDGQGISRAHQNNGASLHLGILGMREQLRPWGGTVTVEDRPRGGTLVQANVNVTLGENR